jgi:hypothetical protein
MYPRFGGACCYDFTSGSDSHFAGTDSVYNVSSREENYEGVIAKGMGGLCTSASSILTLLEY